MTRRRWIADEVHGNRACLVGAHADHLVRVLRVRVGQEFDVSTGTKIFRGIVAAVHDQKVEFNLAEELSSSGPGLNITLALAIFKFDRMEWAIEKCTELGVSRIVPLITRRTDARLAAASSKRVERWERIAQQASEQSRRVTPPEMAPPLKLKDVLSLSASRRVILSEAENVILLKDVLQQESPTDIVLAIGPEGGWADSELALFRDAGWVSVSLGQNILRTETAAIAALAIAASMLS